MSRHSRWYKLGSDKSGLAWERRDKRGFRRWLRRKGKLATQHQHDDEHDQDDDEDL